MRFQCFDHIVRTCRGVAAITSQPWRNSQLVKFHQNDKRSSQNFLNQIHHNKCNHSHVPQYVFKKINETNDSNI